MTANKLLGPGISTKWAVVETPAMVVAVERFSNDSLRFFHSIGAAVHWLERVDVVLASGSLQFPEKPRRVMELLTSLAASRIFLTRTPVGNFGDGADRVFVQISRLQDNGIGSLPEGFTDREVRYPSWIFDRTAFEERLAQTHRIAAIIDEGGGHWGYMAERR